MPLLGLQPRDHSHDERASRDAELVAQRAGRGGGGEARQVDAVGNDAELRPVATLAADLVLDARRRHDQSVHVRSQPRQRGLVIGRAHARGVDGGHDHRRPGGDGGAGADDLGAEHVGVDEVDLVAPQPGGELPDGELVIGLVEDVDGDAQAPEARDRRAGRQGEGAHVVAGAVEAQQEAGVALLRPAVATGGEELQDPGAVMTTGPMRPPRPAVFGAADGSFVIRRAAPRGGHGTAIVGMGALKVKAAGSGVPPRVRGGARNHQVGDPIGLKVRVDARPVRNSGQFGPNVSVACAGAHTAIDRPPSRSEAGANGPITDWRHDRRHAEQTLDRGTRGAVGGRDAT